MKRAEDELKDHFKVLNYLRRHYPIFHQSNVFLRDIQYGIQAFLKDEGMIVAYGTAENLAWKFIGQLMSLGIFLPIDQQSWVVNYPGFRKPQRQPAQSAKPVLNPGVQKPEGIPDQQASTK